MEDNVFSLAGIANLNVEDVAAVRFEQLPDGLYTFEVKSVGWRERTDDEGDTDAMFAEFKLEVIECKLVTERNGPDKDSLVGKTYTHSVKVPNPMMDQEGFVKGLGRIRAFLEDLGLESKGPFGGDGATIGILDAAVGHSFSAKIVSTRNPNGGDPYKNLRMK